MSEPNQEKQAEGMLSNILKFFLIFFMILGVILIIRFSNILKQNINTETTLQTPIKTLPLPSDTETSPVESSTTTETTNKTTASSQITETTTSSSEPPTVIYPPATIPGWATVTTSNTNFATIQTFPTETTTEPNLPTLDISDEAMMELIEVRYLTIHEKSRPGYKLTDVQNIVVHYTGNPGSTADQNWRNFENNKPYTSAHYIIGMKGEIIQCIPLDEVAWAIGTKEGNYTSISIEVCHPDSTGKFTDASYESLVRLVSWLCRTLGLGRDDVLRHYDYDRTAYTASGKPYIWHKECPLYFANSKDPASHKRWEEFKNDLILD